MGGAASKPIRKFPTTAKPSWTGARTSDAHAPVGGERVPLRASETKNEGIERDSKDPQLLANLSRLGPVRVDHHMTTVRPAAERTQQIFDTRLQSEYEARTLHQPQNRLLASSLTDLLEERKKVATFAQLEELARRYGIDVAKLESVAKFVNSPSVDPRSVIRTVQENGTEKVTMTAMWSEPSVEMRTSDPQS